MDRDGQALLHSVCLTIVPVVSSTAHSGQGWDGGGIGTGRIQSRRLTQFGGVSEGFLIKKSEPGLERKQSRTGSGYRKCKGPEV